MWAWLWSTLEWTTPRRWPATSSRARTSRAKVTGSTTTVTARSWPASSSAPALTTPESRRRDGGVDQGGGSRRFDVLSQVIQGIGWAVVHQQQYNIAVLSLSLGVETTGSYINDPLSAAVEVAWASGLTVVVAAGNSGAGDVTSPGDDPYVLTVGAADNTSSINPAAATVPTWSSSATFAGYSKPNVLAPGVSVVSLRAPGSTIDTDFPAARVGTGYFRGSGTSMSTAITAGLAAIVTARHPNATPDDVKGALVSTARAVPAAPTASGEADLAAALNAGGSAKWVQSFPTALPHLVFGWQNGPWQGSRWQSAAWQGSRWQGSRWQDNSWIVWTQMTDWLGSRWQGSRWQGSRWQTSGWGGNGSGPG